MTPDAMLRRGGGVGAGGIDQLAPAQSFERILDSAFGKPGAFRDLAQAGLNPAPALPFRGPIKVKVNEKGRRLLIVPDKVAHQDIEHVVVDRDGGGKARHGGRA